MRIALIVAAGGQGRRFGRNKQLFVCQGKPLLAHTLAKFAGQDIAQIIIAAGDAAEFKNVLEKYQLKYDNIVAGGQERHHSVLNALQVLRQDITHVFIHDGARPNVSAALWARLKKEAEIYDAVIPVMPVTDTVKVVKDGAVIYTPRRSDLFAAQTPQCFRRKIILRAYAEIDPACCTDDALLVEKLGIPVHTVPGEAENIKITVPADLRALSV
ncbi:MAG: 2-C-methyl-D-erythritol 4-phosphate cytidylyltransferase [Candidatus Margulisbacteria bacterium]|jgi:2-C-methyl-D-erythritol 4-phosphate cytidylyltransferase|nr:2-C-methyl-D-erythritol 4-phosphate cytidylyltransferase [Candidatus Margulisiibacteriota bacterium]